MTSSIKTMLLLCLASLTAMHHLNAQTPIANRQQNNILPHSPEAEAIAKNTALPVTLYTGLPEISVPIYEIKGKSLHLSVGLGYNFNGFRPAEMSSYTGLGWSVQGGGVITRMVKGRADNLDIGTSGGEYEDYASMQTMAGLKHEVLEKMALGLIDGEPDLYVFNCGGLSGKFILLKDKAYVFPYQNIKVDKIGTGFRITATNGDQYDFTISETTVHHNTAGALTVHDHASSWYITQIISADKADTINYTYDTYRYHQPPMYAETYTRTFANGSTVSTDIHTITPVTGDRIDDARTLASISYKNIDITFNTDPARRRDNFFMNDTTHALAVVSVSISGQPYRTFNLEHAYYNGKLSLKGVNVYGALGVSGNVQKYRFEYENEDTSSVVAWDSKSIDRYGYYNGANGNDGTMLFGHDDIPDAKYLYGDRTPRFYAAKTGILRKIIYPTGGYTVLDYEQNMLNDSVAGPGLRVKAISIFDNLNTGGASLLKTYTYGNAVGSFKLGVDAVEVMDLGDMCVYQAECSSPLPSNHLETTFQTGTYSALSDLINTSFYYGSVTEVNRSATGTGRSIYEFSSYNGEDPEVYLWRKTDQAYIGSSFVNMQQATNAYNYRVKMNFIGVRARLSQKAHTPDVCFACATPLSPDPTEPTNGLNSIYVPEVVNLWTSGYKRLTETTSTTWDGSGTNPIVNTVKYYYDNNEHPYPTRMVTQNSKGEELTTHMKYAMDYTPAGASTRNNIDSVFAQERITAATTYDSCYSSLVTALVSYQPYYSNPSGFNSVLSGYHCESDFLSNTTDSYTNRDAAWTNYYSTISAEQSSSTVPWQQAVYWMLGNNMLTPMIEKYITVHKTDGNDYLLSASRNEYSIVNGVALLTSVRATELSKPLLYSTFLASTDSYYQLKESMGYDTERNLSFHRKAGDLTESYLWGYRSQYPVAVVSNATPSAISGYASASVLMYPDDAPSLRVELDKVRNALASSLSMVSTYTFLVGRGITSSKDASGKITYYEYDDFGRLNIIRNQDSQIVKKYCYLMNGAQSDCNGSPIYYNDEMTRYYTKQGCGSTAVASQVGYTVPAGRYASPVSAEDANNKAASDTVANGQEYANAHGFCFYYNTEITANRVKNNCVSGTPDTVSFTVYAHSFGSTVSQAQADSLALAYLNANAQTFANNNGSCRNSSCSETPCSSGMRCINGICKSGTKVYTSTTHLENGKWECTFHYEYEDGYVSADETEQSFSQCPVNMN